MDEVSEFLKSNPQFNSDKYLFVSIDEMDFLNDGELVIDEEIEISVEFLKKILFDSTYHDKIKRFMNGDEAIFTVTSIKYGDFYKPISCSKVEIIYGLIDAFNSGLIEESVEGKKFVKELISDIDFSNFEESVKDEEYTISIDGKEYSFKVKDLIQFMKMAEDDVYDLLFENGNFKGIPIEYFAYAGLSYFNENKIESRYILPEEIEGTLSLLRSDYFVDTYAVNKYFKTTDTLYKNVEINSELRNRILDGMPTDASELEKAIYIYIKMCKILKYDDEYYAEGQRGEVKRKHSSLEHVKDISVDNNKVVCYEFNMIYSKLLSEIPINFQTNYKGLVDEQYGDGHANLTFRVGNVIVNADSVTSILRGDLYRAKRDERLEGLKCENRNIYTQEKFSTAVSKMYRLIVEQEKGDVSKVEQEETFEHIISGYGEGDFEIALQLYQQHVDSHTTNTEDSEQNTYYGVSLVDRFGILLDRIEDASLGEVDTLSYVLELKHILFTENELNDNISFLHVQDRVNMDQGQKSTATGIISFSPTGFNDENNITYYLYHSDFGVRKTTREEIVTNFNNGDFGFIRDIGRAIPGILMAAEESEEMPVSKGGMSDHVR